MTTPTYALLTDITSYIIATWEAELAIELPPWITAAIAHLVAQ